MKRISLKAVGLAILLAGGFGALSTGCTTVAATGERKLNMISEEQEIRMGREADAEITASMGLYPDEAMQNYVKTIGLRIAAASERPKLPWTFRVVDDETVNAFALPGGFVYVTRGILSTLGSEDQLVGVMGHEIGHVTGMHSVIRISEAQLTQLGLGIAGAVAPGLQSLFGLAGSGIQLMFLKFSREDELEADELGARYMVDTGADPRELISVMRTLEGVSGASGGKAVPEWTATHPTPAKREEKLTAQIRSLGAGRGSYGPVERDSYLRRLSGMVYGPNPREGYSRGSVFYHPDLRFRFVFPDGWKIINQKAAVVGISPGQDAALQIGLAKEKGIDAAARGLTEQKGISTSGVRRVMVNGLSVWTGAFIASGGEEVLEGQAAFIDYGGRTYQLIGYSSRADWPGHSAAVRKALSSFGELSEKEALSVQPLRLGIEPLGRSMTLREFQKQSPSSITLEELALINQVEPDAVLPAGRLLKRITGERLKE